jgi:hypothetical protein
MLIDCLRGVGGKNAMHAWRFWPADRPPGIPFKAYISVLMIALEKYYIKY